MYVRVCVCVCLLSRHVEKHLLLVLLHNKKHYFTIWPEPLLVLFHLLVLSVCIGPSPTYAPQFSVSIELYSVKMPAAAAAATAADSNATGRREGETTTGSQLASFVMEPCRIV